MGLKKTRLKARILHLFSYFNGVFYRAKKQKKIMADEHHQRM